MLTFNPTGVTISELAQRYKSHRLNLEPAFQRQSVWTPRDRSRLADSILAGFPIPALFFHKQEGKAGAPSYDVIDGKQRIESILAFMNHPDFDHWPYVKAHTVAEDGTEKLTQWAVMTPTERYEFNCYQIQAIEVSGDLGDVIDLFVRINSTGRHLTPAEKNHAKYYTSDLLKAAQSLAKSWHYELSHWKVISGSQVQRMKDIELMTELLLAAAHGGPLNKKQALDKALQNDAIAPLAIEAARKEVNSALSTLSTLLPKLQETRFRRLADFYSLVVLLIQLKAEGRVVNGQHSNRNKLAGGLLTSFANEVDRIADLAQKLKPTTKTDHFYVGYLQTVKEGTDRLDQRKTREKILREVLGTVFEQKDAQRIFNETQRRILWNASTGHKCGICNQTIKTFREMHVDHVVPHSGGGATSLANAQLAHATCNQSKGAQI